MQSAHIVPDWSSINVTESHSGQKNALCVSVKLTIGDCSNPRAEGGSDSANSTEEVESFK